MSQNGQKPKLWLYFAVVYCLAISFTTGSQVLIIACLTMPRDGQIPGLQVNIKAVGKITYIKFIINWAALPRVL